MIKKKKLILIPIVFVFVFIGIIKINIVNTKALSPLGNSDNNYKIVSSEFGSDFEEFIQDKSSLKIYPNSKDSNTIVKIKDLELSIDGSNSFITTICNGYENTVEAFSNIINHDNKKEDEEESKESNNSELNNIISDYIKYRNNIESELNNDENNELDNGENKNQDS